MHQEKQDKDILATMSSEQNASLIANTILSIVRDRSISSAYGLLVKIMQDEGLSESLPSISCFFSDELTDRLKKDITEKLGERALNLPLYSGEGDLLGQLARILVICNEILSQKRHDLIDKADEEIGHLGSCTIDDGAYVRHLRNAVLHGHFNVDVDGQDPFSSIIHFWDINPHKNGKAVDLRLNIEDLNNVIDILIKDVCLTYLKGIGWSLE